MFLNTPDLRLAYKHALSDPDAQQIFIDTFNPVLRKIYPKVKKSFKFKRVYLDVDSVCTKPVIYNEKIQPWLKQFLKIHVQFDIIDQYKSAFGPQIIFYISYEYGLFNVNDCWYPWTGGYCKHWNKFMFMLNYHVKPNFKH
jgi:hypothetical protein